MLNNRCYRRRVFYRVFVYKRHLQGARIGDIMSAYFVQPAFDCLVVLANEAARNNYGAFSFTHTGNPTNATEYASMITWTDTDHPQPSWTDISVGFYNDYISDYWLGSPNRTEVGYACNDLDYRIT